jgi:hypothetical protein
MTRVFFLCLSAAALASACIVDTGSETDNRPCTKEGLCPAGYSCVSDVCVAAGEKDAAAPGLDASFGLDAAMLDAGEEPDVGVTKDAGRRDASAVSPDTGLVPDSGVSCDGIHSLCPGGCCQIPSGQSIGSCIAGNANDACDHSGKLCLACIGATPTCTNGVCTNDCDSLGHGICSKGNCCDTSNKICVSGDSVDTCGLFGPCKQCDKKLADKCVDGACLCGTSPACAANEQCVNGGCTCSTCTCNATTCPNGCCDSTGACVTVPTNTQCGTAGSDCVDCAKTGTCQKGICQCGLGGVCGAGQACNMGLCECDLHTCKGCCEGKGPCVVNDPKNCGAPGTTCAPCDLVAADTCTPAGVCKCGANAACIPGLHCLASQCVCDSVGCPSGCCDVSGKCNTSSGSTCGTGGATCLACDPNVADGCDATTQTCKCGSGPACSGVRQCVGGACVCPASQPYACGTVCVADCGASCPKPFGCSGACVASCSTCAAGRGICGATATEGQHCVDTCLKCGSGLDACPATLVCIKDCTACSAYPHVCSQKIGNGCVKACSDCITGTCQ